MIIQKLPKFKSSRQWQVFALILAVCAVSLLFLLHTAHAKVSTPDVKATAGQSTYRLYSASTQITPGTPLAGGNTNAALAGIGSDFRLRLGVTNTSEPYIPTTVKELATARNHACAIANDDWVYCWSTNVSGYLGIGRSSSAISAPTPIVRGDMPVGATIKSIAMSNAGNHSCAIASDDWLYCWGSNTKGQLGIDNSGVTLRTYPSAVIRGAIPTGATIKSVSAGTNHTCVVASDNRSYCWGSNVSGQLGDNTATDRTTPVAVVRGSMPSNRYVKQLSAGGASTCAVTTNNKPHCWGENSDGRLATGNTTTRQLPTAVVQGDMPSGFTAKDITVGGVAMCIIANDDKAYCAGTNNGQLGVSGSANAGQIRAVQAGAIPNGGTMKKIVMATNHACAIANNDKVYCWGTNVDGRLGVGSTTSSTTPVEAHQGDMPSGKLVSALAAGNAYNCAVSSDNWVYCWGNNDYAQLASGDTYDVSTPSKVLSGAMSDGIRVESVSSGDYSSCAVGDDDWAYCWGWNRYGKLGDGTTNDRRRPVKVSRGAIPTNASIVSLETGDEHACAVASDKWAYCWGKGAAGELGNSDTTDRYTPVKVSQGDFPSGSTILDVSASRDLSCAIASDNWAYCWGDNQYGRRGAGHNGGNRAYSEKVAQGAIPAGATIQSISVGVSAACALASDNWVYCWGNNESGALGDNTNINRSSPTALNRGAIPAGVTLQSVTAGDEFACALASNNKIYCWGDNVFGNLGNDTTSSTQIPVAVHQGDLESGATIRSVSAGYDYACANTTDNKAYCWGRDTDRQTGWDESGDPHVPKRIIQGDLGVSTDVTSISGGGRNTCLTGSDGRAYCIGFNDSSGILGNGSKRLSSVPAKVDSGEYNPDHTIASGALSLKLQYAPKASATTCSAVSSGWNDVTASSAIGFGSAPPANGTAISAHGNDPAAPTASGFAYQSIVQSGSDFTNLAAISPQKTGLWDFSLADKSSTSNTPYCLRVIPTNPDLSIDAYSQYPQITTALGSLGVQFVNASGTPLVGAAKNTSFASRVVQLAAQTSTANLTNTTSKQLEVHNSLSNSGWNVSIAATNGPSSSWQSATHSYSYNSSAANGRLTVGMNSSSVTAHGTSPSGQICSPTAGITKPTSNTPYQNGTVDAITLLSGSSSAGFNCSWRLRNVLLTQNIPAAQPAGNYSLDMTVTTVAQ